MNRSGFINILDKEVEVLFHPNRSLIGLKGRVIYESEGLIHLSLDSGRIVKVPKKGIILKVYGVDEDKMLITYKELMGSIVRRLERV